MRSTPRDVGYKPTTSEFDFVGKNGTSNRLRVIGPSGLKTLNNSTQADFSGLMPPRKLDSFRLADSPRSRVLPGRWRSLDDGRRV